MGDVLGARSPPVRSGVQLPAFCFGGALRSLPPGFFPPGGDLQLGAVTVLSKAASDHPGCPTVISESSRG